MRRETVKGFQTVPWNSAWTKHNSSAFQKCSTLLKPGSKILQKTGNQRVVVRIFVRSSHYESKTTSKVKRGYQFLLFSAQGVWRIYYPQTPRSINNPFRDITLIFSYFYEIHSCFLQKMSLQNVRYWDYVKCCQRQKKQSRKYHNKLDTQCALRNRIFLILGKLSKAYFPDSCGHSKCYAFSRKKKIHFRFNPKKTRLYISGQM